MATQAVVPRYLFTVDEYYRMADAGIFGEDSRVELIQGEIVPMAAIGNRHASVVARLDDLFHRRISMPICVWTQNPVRLDNRSEPQPDICLLEHREDFYSSGKPRANDVLLLIEVSDSSLDYDRLEKLPVYAGAGVPEVWIVNLTEETVEVSAEPQDGAYTKQSVLHRGEAVAPAAFPTVGLMVDDILGPASG